MRGVADSVVIGLWDQAMLQLDAHTRSRNIKLSGTSFKALGEQGEHYFKQQASLLLNGPAEFHVDASNNNRIYLGISAEFVQQFGFAIQHSQGNRLPSLFPPMFQSGLYSPASQSTSASRYGTPSLRMPSSDFTFETPTPAPRYPISSPMQLGAIQSTAGPSSAQKRSIEMVNASSRQSSQSWSQMNTPQSSASGVSDEYRDDDDNDDEDNDDKPHVKRPCNSWILFRQAHHPIIAQKYPKIHNSQISKIISNIWKNMTKEEKKPWVDLALAKKEEHKRLNPGYKYKPAIKKNKPSAKRVKIQGQPALADPIEFFDMDAFRNDAGKNVANQSLAPQSTPGTPGQTGLVTPEINSQKIIDQVMALELTPEQLGLADDSAQNEDNQNIPNQTFTPQTFTPKTFTPQTFAPQAIPEQTGFNYNDPQGSSFLPQMSQQEPQQYQPGEFSDMLNFSQGGDEFLNEFDSQFLNFD
ncbi:hypothetical protein GQX73_g2876 [Xylaria multiplex]|uniref:HMG box domain-containing protein n=1 Tax=Xylaria multiplex TaxID=323545 RepID=A0A7C8IUK9_9PEZI|nr:hypothetical protein GQX73_g2876 [Xylaria multiplex]